MNKYDTMFLRIAYEFAEQSYCKRRQVGAVIAIDSRPISGGYNGTVSGSDNCCEEEYETLSEIETRILDINKGESAKEIAFNFCKEFDLVFETFKVINDKIELRYRRPKVRTKASVVHAEANAITFAAKSGISTNDATIYVTLSPCINCANLIIQSGIKRVVYAESYRDSAGLQHLKNNGIIIKKIQLKY